MSEYLFVLFVTSAESYLAYLQMFAILPKERIFHSASIGGFSLLHPIIDDLREFEIAVSAKVDRPPYYWVVYRILKKVVEWNPFFLHAICLLCVTRFHGLTEAELCRILCGGSLRTTTTGTTNFRKASTTFSRQKQGMLVQNRRNQDGERMKDPKREEMSSLSPNSFLQLSQFEFTLLRPLIMQFVDIRDGVMFLSKPVYYEVISDCFIFHERMGNFIPDEKIRSRSPSPSPTSTKRVLKRGDSIKRTDSRKIRLVSDNGSPKGAGLQNRMSLKRQASFLTSFFHLQANAAATFKSEDHYLCGIYLALHEGAVSNRCARLLPFCLFQMMAEAHRKENRDEVIEIANEMNQLLLKGDVSNYLFSGPRPPSDIQSDVSLHYRFSGIPSEIYQSPELYALVASISASGIATENVCTHLLGSFAKKFLRDHHKFAKILFHKCAEAGNPSTLINFIRQHSYNFCI
jgi:hypothetical protein